jgi:hypothetical protein
MIFKISIVLEDRFVKANRISWVGHVERMEDSRMPKSVMREKIYTWRKNG